MRFLQEKEFCRIGSNLPVKVNVRIIAATNQNLEKRVKAGSFREDLYYRLNVLKLKMPSLKDHREDIPVYVQHFLVKYHETFGKRIVGITDEALRRLKSYQWKGNIRELENVVQRAMLMAKGEKIDISNLEYLEAEGLDPLLSFDPQQGLEGYVKALTEQVERKLILEALNQTHWNRTEAAERLKISRKTLFNKMQQYGIKGR